MVPQNDVRLFREQKQLVHPELADLVTWRGFTAIARREGIGVRLTRLSRPARLLRLGQFTEIQIDRRLPSLARTRFGLHELAHYWRDCEDVPCYYADNEWVASESEDFAELFSWLCTHPGPLPGIR